MKQKLLQLTPTISAKDLARKVAQAAQWVADGDQVAIEVRLRGRIKMHADILLPELYAKVAALAPELAVTGINGCNAKLTKPKIK